MKFLHLLPIAIVIGSIGLSLPARADDATIDTSVQTVTVTGNHNSVNQSNNSTIDNRSRNNRDNQGTVVRSRQNADVLGDNNTVNQSNDTQLRQSRYRNR